MQENGRGIKSFVIRNARMSESQRLAYERLREPWVLSHEQAPVAWQTLFPHDEKRVVEIGFGMGDATWIAASEHPRWSFLGIEVHKPGVGKLLWWIKNKQLNNIRIVEHDAVEVLRDMLSVNSVDAIHIWFPDPWPKKRHHKRRLVQKEFAQLCAGRLRAGGYLHVATDWQNYADAVLETLEGLPMLKNTHERWAPRPEYRPVTKFEAKGMAAGRTIRDIIFRKVEE